MLLNLSKVDGPASFVLTACSFVRFFLLPSPPPRFFLGACLPVCGSELVCLAKAVIYGSKLAERVPSPSDLETALERPLDFAKIIHTKKEKGGGRTVLGECKT